MRSSSSGTSRCNSGRAYCKKNGRILLANSNQWYFNNLVKKPCHNTYCRYPHRLNLSFQSSRSCALPNIKVLKDKDLEFANSIRALSVHLRGRMASTMRGTSEGCWCRLQCVVRGYPGTHQQRRASIKQHSCGN